MKVGKRNKHHDCSLAEDDTDGADVDSDWMWDRDDSGRIDVGSPSAPRYTVICTRLCVAVSIAKGRELVTLDELLMSS